MFHLKPSLRIVVIMVLINDPSSSFILSGAIYFLVPSFLSTQFFFPLVAEFHLSFEMFSIRPYQVYSFRCGLFQQLRVTLLFKMLFKLIGGRRCCFLLRSFVPSIQLLFFRSGGIVLLFSSTHLLVLSRSCSFHDCPFNRSVVPSFQVLSPYQVLIQFLSF